MIYTPTKLWVEDLYSSTYIFIKRSMQEVTLRKLNLTSVQTTTRTFIISNEIVGIGPAVFFNCHIMTNTIKNVYKILRWILIWSLKLVIYTRWPEIVGVPVTIALVHHSALPCCFFFFFTYIVPEQIYGTNIATGTRKMFYHVWKQCFCSIL